MLCVMLVVLFCAVMKGAINRRTIGDWRSLLNSCIRRTELKNELQYEVKVWAVRHSTVVFDLIKFGGRFTLKGVVTLTNNCSY